MSRSSAKLAVVVGAVALALGLTGASAVTTSSYSSGDLTALIYNDPGAPRISTMTVPTLGQIADVNVSVRIAHPNTADLDILLRHPDGTTVDLSSDNGAGADFGSGATTCSGTFTVFDDEAAAAITSGVSPFTSPSNSFRPEGSLADLDGKATNGAWKLELTDDSAGAEPPGTLYCWKIDITFAESDLVVTLTDSPDPVGTGDDLTYTVSVKNNGPDGANGVRLTQTLPAGATIVTTTASQGTCTGSGPIVCDLGTLAAGATVTGAFVVNPANAGTVVATATASGSPIELVLADNTASATTTVQTGGGGGSETIVVTLLGDGDGSVTSEPGGIDCGLDCVGAFDTDEEVTLTAAAADGSTHTKWGGACSGTLAGAPCVLTAGGELEVTATFAREGGGSGSDSGVWYDICTIVGTNGPDVLRGTAGRDVICGLGGNDKLYGLDGNDRLYGNGGKDQLYGGNGSDTFYSKDKFADRLFGGPGRDRAKADGRDSLDSVEAVV